MKFANSLLVILSTAIIPSAFAADVLGVSEQGKIGLFILTFSIAFLTNHIHIFVFTDISKYQPDTNGKWACLGNPEIVLSFSQVNDDICDCPDGSDEPGTAACPKNLFHCRNEGHIPGKLPSNRVNDGICDYDICCDGSDEAGLIKSLKGTDQEFKCENKCAEMHKEYVERIESERKLLKNASEKRNALIKKAIDNRIALQKELNTKEKSLGELKQKLVEKEKTLEQVKLRDAESKRNRKDQGEALGVKPPIVVEAKEVLEKVSNAYKKASDDVLRLNAEISTLSELLEKMKTEYNPNFNDPAVKQAIRSFEEYKANSNGVAAANDLDQLKTAEQVPNVLEGLESYRAPSAGDSQTSLISEYKKKAVDYAKPALIWLAENGIISFDFEETLASGGSSDPEEDSAELKVHKNIVKKAQDEVSDLERQVSEIRSSYTTSHGPNDILRSLKDTCVSNDLGEYTYEFCFYGGAHQKSNKDSSTVDLGKFDNVSYNEAQKSLVLNFENGARCWSGPIRRATITLKCGTEDKILQVTEPERCEYFIRGISPAACGEYKEDSVTKLDLLTVHDEL